jgi:hypoxanthine phosphoribosyltransferase
MGKLISEIYEGQEILLVGVLKGAVMFLVDLARRIEVPVSMDFMAVSSYGASTESSGIVRILKDLDQSVEGKNVLVVEDIVDTGLTLRYILDYIRAHNPASLRVVALLNKKKARKADVAVDYVGFEIQDRFVVGYGLDYAERYRNLPFIAELSFEK